MSFNIKTIVNAWATSFNPTNAEKSLAEARLEICNACPSMKTVVGVRTCTSCGCPVSKKVFTSSFNPCPELKWENVDKGIFNIKKKKTIL